MSIHHPFIKPNLQLTINHQLTVTTPILKLQHPVLLMAENGYYPKPHFVLFPFMAQGHTIPIIDIAKLLAQRGAAVTLLLTPLNHIKLHPILARANEQGLTIRVEELTFPSKEAGLPPGCESFDALPSNSMAFNFIYATTLLEPQVTTLLMTMRPKPSCLLADMCYTYASAVTKNLGIPRILFHGTCAFALLCAHRIHTSKVLENVRDLSETFDVPHMPDKISFTVSQIRATLSPDKSWEEFRQKLIEDEEGSLGVVFNTFEELEPEYIRAYEEEEKKKVWCVGPVSLCNKEKSDKVARGNTASVNEEECLKWLDTWEPSNVIYACLGSLCNLPAAQMLELGLGLEASGWPFIWVVRSGEDENSKKLKEMMFESGLEERLKNSSKGLVIWGWAPQVLILSHPAVGGFLTHCGWNSSLEGIAAGLPMVTWPLFAEQFYNEKLIVVVLRIGVEIGVKRMMQFGKEEEVGVQVSWERVKECVEELMDGGEKAVGRRKKAKELAEKARRAVEEGGSSYVNIGKLIEDVRNFA